MVVYFSGTGNSRYAAKLIAHRLGDAATDAGAYIKSGTAAALGSDKPWVFVSPTNAWNIPRVFEAFIRGGSFTGDRRAYFVMTCGDDIGAADGRLRALCADTGFEYMGVEQVVMPENYVAMFDVPDKGEAAAIIEKAVPDMERAAAVIARGGSIPGFFPTFADKFKTNVVNPVFYAFFVKSKKFFATDACIGRGKCQAVCPTNTVKLCDGRPVWGEGCVHCMACICSCPKKAIEYGKISVGKPRYLCPEFTADK